MPFARLIVDHLECPDIEEKITLVPSALYQIFGVSVNEISYPELPSGDGVVWSVMSKHIP